MNDDYEFYEIIIKHLNKLVVSNVNEVFSDGVKRLKLVEVREMKGKLREVVTLEDVGLGKHVSQINLFPKRAIF